MLIEIWSDIMCPFCYIGKHHFETALDQVNFKDKLKIQYRSYMLNPDYYNVEGESTYSMLSRTKGITIDQAKDVTQRVVQMGTEVGLSINFDTNIPANTFKSHELIHLASKYKIGSQVKELLFEAHFNKGKNIEDIKVLINIADEAGIPKEEVEKALQSDEFAYAVKQDIQEARNLGIQGVPFFLFDRKYAVSGAQPVSVFFGALTKSFEEWKKENPSITILNKDDQSLNCNDDSCNI